MSEINQQVKRVNDDNLLIKYKSAGVKDSVIAAKLGIAIAEVASRWKRLVEVANLPPDNGREALHTQFNTLAIQYQLLGESLKVIAAALGDTMPPSEIAELIVEGDAAQTLKNLNTRCIVVKPFTPVDPVQALEQATQIIQQSN